MNYLAIITLATTLALGAQAADAGDLRLVPDTDKRMNRAFEKAQQTLDAFLKLVRERPKKYSRYSAYVKFVDGGKTEYLWVADVKPYKDNYYMGVIVSKPGMVKNVKYGQTIAFEKKEIYDFMYYEKLTGKAHGGYTTCALLNPDNPDDMKFLKESGLECEL